MTIIWLSHATPETLKGLNLSRRLATLDNGEEARAWDTELWPFYRLRWFNRLWVIQEVVFMLGQNTIDWELISKTCNMTKPFQLRWYGMASVVKISNIRQQIQNCARLDLLSTIAECRPFGYTNHIDRIFATQALWTHGTPAEDFGREEHANARYVLAAIPAMLIEYEVSNNWPSTLDSIAFAGTPNSIPDWPSWAPDWTWECACNRPFWPYFSVHNSKFRAAGTWPMGDVAIRKNCYRWELLCLDGKAFDKVHVICEQHPSNQLGDQMARKL
ncbi:hypothetical protein BDV23DRAFT_184890 [Aspergillus alliaceus]|uniref:Heterokaryon incompatibility domain-containing protein n=1 Tax=Petromyces alliaceus TaxID=209559 RepID=A0A5N7C460_PETAA|nr:hypothetical protein BDV23DRAFT_184890 [Aspergillus alliaceus]